jgi:VWFA-related protein
VPRNLTIVTGYLLGAVLVCVCVLDSQVNPAQEPVGGEHALKAESPLVVLDVVVTDKKGEPVHGLKASDFTVLEKDQKMTLQSFEEYRYDKAPPPAPLPARQALGPNVFTNVADTRSDGRLNVLLMDALNTPMAEQMYVREQMLEYVKKAPQGARIAIFGLSNRLYLLQGFTTDPAILKADLEMFRAEKVAVPPPLRGPYTLAAIENLARYLSDLPGRKNLIWFAGSFPRVIPDSDQENGFGLMANFAHDMKWIANLLMRSQVAVYPVDARPVQQSGNECGCRHSPGAELGAKVLKSGRACAHSHERAGRGDWRQGLLRHERPEGGGAGGYQRRLQLLHPRLRPHQSPMGWPLPQRAREVRSTRHGSLLPSRILCI